MPRDITVRLNDTVYDALALLGRRSGEDIGVLVERAVWDHLKRNGAIDALEADQKRKGDRMGGKPNPGTPADKRLEENQGGSKKGGGSTSTPSRPPAHPAGRVIPKGPTGGKR